MEVFKILEKKKIFFRDLEIVDYDLIKVLIFFLVL